MLVSRSRKMYQSIQCLLVIFKVVKKRSEATDPSDYDIRLLTAIKAFLIEHTLFPVQFVFRGNDFLNQLKGSMGDNGIGIEDFENLRKARETKEPTAEELKDFIDKT